MGARGPLDRRHTRERLLPSSLQARMRRGSTDQEATMHVQILRTGLRLFGFGLMTTLACASCSSSDENASGNDAGTLPDGAKKPPGNTKDGGSTPGQDGSTNPPGDDTGTD